MLRATPAELKNDTRIDALGFCLYAALLIHALIERELLNAMAQAGIRHLPLYPEDRPRAADQVTVVPSQLSALQSRSSPCSP